MGEWLQLAALLGAFWTAVLLYRGDRPVRFVAALALGAGLAHGGWALLHLPAVLEHPWALLDISRGFSVLFVPLGLLLLAPTAAAFATLPLALAVARGGCLAAGCCHGTAGEPTPLAEIGGLVMLHLVIRRLPARWVLPAVLAGMGLVRLATEPWRASPPLGEPILEPAALAALWVTLGLLWAAARALRRPVLLATVSLLALGCTATGGPVNRLAPPDEEPDYLRYVAFETPDHSDVLLRWPKREMPLRIYLPPAPAELFPNHEEITQRTRDAVLAWTDVAGPGLPSFRFVDSAGDAHIPVNWAEQSPSRSVAHVMYDVDLFQRRFGVANLLVTGRYRDGELATPQDLYVTIMHEMGHALGLGGHSPNPEDVMYGFSGRNDSRPEDPDGASTGGTAEELTARDRATLRALYASPIGKRVGRARRAY